MKHSPTNSEEGTQSLLQLYFYLLQLCFYLVLGNFAFCHYGLTSSEVPICCALQYLMHRLLFMHENSFPQQYLFPPQINTWMLGTTISPVGLRGEKMTERRCPEKTEVRDVLVLW